MSPNVTFKLLELVFIFLGRFNPTRRLIAEEVMDRGNVALKSLPNFIRLHGLSLVWYRYISYFIVIKIGSRLLPFFSSFSYSSSFRLSRISIEDLTYSMITKASTSCN